LIPTAGNICPEAIKILMDLASALVALNKLKKALV
jgi:hypothetical protein